MDLKSSQEAFDSLLNRVDPKCMAEFLDWIQESYVIKNDDNVTVQEFSSNKAESEATLELIVQSLRGKLPLNAIVSTERVIHPEYGCGSEWDPDTTVHVDSFLYDEEELDELVDQGRLSRTYCRQCGSRTTAPLTFVSHSLSVAQLRFIFTALLPPEMLSDKRLLDVGSRLGSVLYAAFVFSPRLRSIVGVEMNVELCAVQSATLWEFDMTKKVSVAAADVRQRADLVGQADVLVLNNVFQFFLPPQDQLDCWRFLRENCRPAALLLTNPDLQTLTGHLTLDFAIDDWLDKIPIETTTAKYCGTNKELFEDCSTICLYQVK